MSIFEETSERGIAYMIDRGYSADTVGRHEREWAAIAEFAEDRGITALTQELRDGYVQRIKESGRAWSTQAEAIRRVDHLFQFADTGRFKGQISLKPYAVDEEGWKLLKAYEADLKNRGMAGATVLSRVRESRRFLSMSCKGKAVEELTQPDVVCYIEKMAKSCTPKSIELARHVLRDFFGFLSRDGRTVDAGITSFLHAKAARARPPIPTVYSAEELVAILDSASENSRNPKRDYALILIAIRYGLRKSDILEIKFSDLDPEGETLFVSQRKTGKTNLLPLMDEVMIAIADYVKNERPESDEPYIFLNSNPPFRPCREANQGVLEHIIRRSMFMAGVQPRGRHTGAHAIRRSLATTMMNEEVSYPVISSILGHGSAEKSITGATMAYIAIDTERMRKLSLEVPE